MMIKQSIAVICLATLASALATGGLRGRRSLSGESPSSAKKNVAFNDVSRVSPSIDPLPLVYVRDQQPADPKLGRCEGDCDRDDDCEGDLICFQRDEMGYVYGCIGAENEGSRTDFCAPPEANLYQPSVAPTSSLVPSSSPSNVEVATWGASAWFSPTIPYGNFPLGMAFDETSDSLADDTTIAPSEASGYPTSGPTSSPSVFPSDSPSPPPSAPPSSDPTGTPSRSPSSVPSGVPTDAPAPSSAPTISSSQSPSNSPSVFPSSPPSDEEEATVPMVVSSSSAYGGNSVIHLPRPSEMQIGDLLVLFLSRTDDPLPLKLNGWNTQATCFKQNNGHPWCITAEMCREYDGDYCKVFRRDNESREYDGHDLGTIVMTRTTTKEDIRRSEYMNDLNGSQPGWAILVVVRGADTSNPIVGWAGVTCDGIRQSKFMSTSGESNDLLFMHMAFDDTSRMRLFTAPAGSQYVAFTKGPDEAGFLFAETLKASGQTGDRYTGGDGGSACKDVNISIVVRAAGN